MILFDVWGSPFSYNIFSSHIPFARKKNATPYPIVCVSAFDTSLFDNFIFSAAFGIGRSFISMMHTFVRRKTLYLQLPIQCGYLSLASKLRLKYRLR